MSRKSSIIDFILTNVLHKYSTASIFANDISDHCVDNARIIIHGFLLFYQICFMSATWHGQKLGKQIYIQIGLILDDFNACTVAVKTAKAEHFFIQTSNNLNNS